MTSIKVINPYYGNVTQEYECDIHKFSNTNSGDKIEINY